MISFIVIGKNEGEKLNWCFNSIKAFTKTTSLECEIIYVDSQSTDGSFELASNDKEIKAFRLQGKCNAAIARNFGAKVAGGNIFCFFDGDMELLPNQIEKLLLDTGKLIHPVVTANRIDVYYDSLGNRIGDNFNPKIKLADKYEIASGGLMLIENEIWNNVNGMDESLQCFEDMDLTFRIFEKLKLKVFVSKLILVKHHTIRYTDHKRYKSLIYSNYFTFKGKLYRKHIFNKTVIFHLFRRDLSLIALMLSIVFSIILNSAYLILFYFFVSIAKLFFINRRNFDIPLHQRFFLDIIKDIKIILGFVRIW